MPNHLAAETSPYLLQHKDNPVDWYPWGEQAFAKAKAEQKPIFLSVGYSSCHWCHVMAHESFEDAAAAESLNANFVCIKVDREERPDVDEAYMAAVQLSSGRGGWPMSVFLTPDRKPFFAGTYFPLASFKSVIDQIAAAWVSDRKQLTDASEEFAVALGEAFTATAPATVSPFDEAFVERSLAAIAAEFDPENGGFGKAPKFPPHGALELLMSYALRPESKDELREAALGMALATLERMCRGGIRDHVGGGFHRYSTDAIWHLPHFEKMLYDNALMLGNLVHASAIAGQLDPRLDALFTEAAQEILEWASHEMLSKEGLFYAAIDADSDGEEGAFYVWTSDEVRTVLGDRAEGFLRAYGFEEAGNFKDEASGRVTGANIPYLADPSGNHSEDLIILRAAREKRPKPPVDDKAIVSWNGLMMGALVDAGRLSAAEELAQAILDAESRAGRLPHQVSKGKPSGLAFLDDYAAFIDGLIRLGSTAALLEELREESPEEFAQLGMASAQMDGRHWLGHAARLAKEMVSRFYDDDRGAFFATSEEHERLFGRTKPVFDQPIPSGNALAIKCLIALGDEERARQSVQCLLGWMERAPHATEALLLAALPLVAGHAVEIADASVPTKAISADVEVSLAAKEMNAGPDGWGTSEVILSVPDGFHINSSEPPARWLVPTRLEIAPLAAKIDYPEAADDQFTGEVRIPFSVELPKGERGAEFEIKVSYQACTETECLEPAEKTLSGVVVR